MTYVSFLISLLCFCLVDMSIGESGVWKSPTVFVSGLMYNLSFYNVLLRMLVILYWGIDVQD